ncbi:glycosyltransferase [Enterococcus faecalis]|uniref:glycosyltransferase n=2 Tax=Enterococcus faecalis TaxID=1351 RepID=UPI0021578842|nr:glycosyltransferase [Enterococcus faecalis]
MKFSVLMSVYHKEKPIYLEKAFQSIVSQTYLPDEVVIVKDGELTQELDELIDKYDFKKIKKKVVPLVSNQGLGIALSIGLTKCSNEIIARVDTDDVNLLNRFEIQIKEFHLNPELAIVGGQIAEFYEEKSIPIFISERKVPTTHQEIIKFSKTRNPFNHMTVMFKKSVILECGNYRNCPLCEDYDLWMRVLAQEYIVKNTPETLVHARTGLEMAERRGGAKYAHFMYQMRKSFYHSGYISISNFIVGTAASTIFALIPATVRKKIYIGILHKK